MANVLSDLNMPPRRKKEKKTEFERGRIIGLREREFSYTFNTSSCAADQSHSDASLEGVDRREPNNSKKYQWMTEGEVNAR